MIREEIYGYYIAVYKLSNNVNYEKLCSDSYTICLATPKKYIKSYRQLINTLYHYLGTLHIKKWIRNNNLRYAAFLLRESQISKITEKLGERGEKRLIVISLEEPGIKLDEENLPFKSEEDSLGATALFRLSIEKERK